MAHEDPEIKRQRDQLRDTMRQQRRTPEQIAAAMARQFGDRPRPAWRHAHGWTQEHVADLFNRWVRDSNASMNANRISDFERWPINGAGAKPTNDTLAILAAIYGTTLSKLVDHYDRQEMTPKELASLRSLEKQASPPSSATRSGLSSAYAESVMTPRQLPNAPPYFVGRAQELDILTAQLEQLDSAAEGAGTVVITAIGGTAGIGKTALAVQWARQHSNQFPDGQLYVNLRGFDPSGTPMTPPEAIRGFLDSFHVPVEKIPISLDAQAAFYRNLVKGKRLVIVLDNARDTDQVRPLLPGSPNCLVLVTSRQQLGSLIAHEGATHITLGFLTTAEARQLLTKILQPIRIHTEPEPIDELIQHCDHLPIALHIAAARILAEPQTSLNALVSQLREQHQRLAALSTGDSQLTDIRAVFSWSYTALSPQTARLFRLLGLHPGPDIGTLAAAPLAGLPEHDTRRLLTELTRAYLLEEYILGRYRFHDLLGVYATEQATHEEPQPQQRAALHRVLDYYLHTSFTANRYLDPHGDSIALRAPKPRIIPSQIAHYEQAMNWFTAEHGILLAAIDHAATQRFDTHAWQLPCALAVFLNRQGHWHDYVATQKTALATADRLGDRTAQARTHRELGYAHTLLGHHTDALANLQQALTLYQELGDHDGQASTHRILGWAYEQQRHYTQALTHAQHALALSRATGHLFGQARSLNNVGWYHALLGQYQQTLTYCQQALDLNRELGELFGEAQTLDSLGYAHHHLGHYDHAITHYQHALRLCHELGDHYSESETLIHLGDTHYTTGNVAAAYEAWQQALTILDQLGHSDAESLRTKLAILDIDPDTGVGANNY